MTQNNRTTDWPKWPTCSKNAASAMSKTVASLNWTARSVNTTSRFEESIFSEKFSLFTGASFCIPTSSGTSALTIALQALGVGAGDEVIIPTMTWIANASSVLLLGACPILADVNPNTSCIDISETEKLITERTKAIVCVHLHCSACSVIELLNLANEHDIPIIEDCAQSIGTCIDKKHVGNFGQIGCFSFNSEKCLAAGEGGAVITNDKSLAYKLQALRSDGYRQDTPIVGLRSFREPFGIVGQNHFMNEFVACLLNVNIETLQHECSIRHKVAGKIDEYLLSTGHIQPLLIPKNVTQRGIYEYAMILSDDLLSCIGLLKFAQRMEERTGIIMHPTDVPLHKNPLMETSNDIRFKHISSVLDRQRLSRRFGNADSLHERMLVFHHKYLLAPSGQIEFLLNNISKILEEGL